VTRAGQITNLERRAEERRVVVRAEPWEKVLLALEV
jgi:hypothetical protein